MTHSFLMVSPIHYKTEDTTIAAQQWSNLRNILIGLGANIIISENVKADAFLSDQSAWDLNKNIIWVGVKSSNDLKFKQTVSLLYSESDFIVRPLELIDDSFQTLNKCFCLLDNGHAIWYPEAFSEHSKYTIELWYKDRLIEISEKDALDGVFDLISINSDIISPRISSKLLSRLQSKGYDVHEINLDIFLPDNRCKSLALRVY